MQSKIFLLFFLAVLTVSAQDKKWSLEASYPFSVGESFGSSNQGVIGAAITYRFAQLGSFKLGASLDASWFATTSINDSDPVQELEFRDFFLQPRIFAERSLTPDDKLRARIGLGWAFSRSLSQAFFNEDGRVEGEDFNSGPNVNLGLSYDFAPRWYALGQYDLILSSGDLPDRTIGVVKIGLGFRF